MPLINFAGLASGIDSEGLIEAISEATRQTRIKPNEDKIGKLQDENDALDELKTLLSELKEITENFTTLAGGIVAKQAGSSDETVLTATASNSAIDGTYTFTVNQLATNATWSFDDRTTDPATPVLAATQTGSLLIQVGNPAGSADSYTVNLTDTTTWNQVVADINSNMTEAVATLVNTGTSSSPSYAIVIQSNNVGEDDGTLTLTTAGDLATVWDDTIGAGSTVDQAQNAEFTLDGIAGTIVRDSNVINDLIQGVTIRLEDSGGPVTLQVETDNTATLAAAQEYVDKYNEIVEYLAENNTITREENGQDVENIFGPLASTRLDDGMLTALRAAMSGATYSSGTSVRIFADMGIKTNRDGTLELDTEEFEDALNDDPIAVGEIFKNLGDELALTNGTIDQYIRFNGLFDITTDGNQKLIDDLNARIARAEAQILREEEALRARFARLESVVSGLQNQQAALTSALAGLGGG